MKDVLAFTEFDHILNRFRPVTPYGKAFKADLSFVNESKRLEAEYKDIALFCRFVTGKPRIVDKIRSHLQRIPWIDDLLDHDLDAADIFLVKKFLLNYSCAAKLLPKAILSAVGAGFESVKLLKYLSPGAPNEEMFVVSDYYSKDLAVVRSRLHQLDVQIERLRGTRLKELRDMYGLDFRFRDFIVYSEAEAKAFHKSRRDIYIESMDSQNVILKPIYTDEHLENISKRDKLVASMKEIEAHVIKEISNQIRSETKTLCRYVAAVERIDVLIAKAIMSVEFKMTRPLFAKAGAQIKIISGVFLPLKSSLDEMKLRYEPLSAIFDTRIGVVHGSNMGGKTVVLRTIGFMQLLAQMGFFVPAKKFQTIIFDRICYIGGESAAGIEGLSSFGLEMHRFIEAYSDRRAKTLYLLDEFAKTTNSNEATALLSGILKVFAKNANIYALFSTHFVDLPKTKDVTFYRMKGLDAAAYSKQFKSDRKYSLHERLKLINSFMKYEVAVDDGKARSFDALKVARIIGMDEDIISNAIRFMEDKDGR